ncbi:MAG: 23S rRNA (adenine(2503)-C(2))-methyltransferase RlmN [Candidatus Uhrbacteria bacterium]
MLIPQTRQEKFSQIFPNEPKFRWTQIEQALFLEKNHNWPNATSLPLAMREKLTAEIPWLSLKRVDESSEPDGSVRKVLLETEDGNRIESVLMQSKSGKFSVCVSTQVGCAMGCAFCSTGKLGLKRHLSADEITDQLRYWQLSQNPVSIPGRDGSTLQNKNLPPLHHSPLREGFEGQTTTLPPSLGFGGTPPKASVGGASLHHSNIITNIVLMGMGEPMNNYENVRSSLNSILKNTGISPTHITVSSAGVLPRLNQLIEDKEWPPVCIAISLHSADPIKRKELMPSSGPNFLPELTEWAKKYLAELGNRSHYITFEYIMLDGINDSDEDARKLAAFTKPLGRAKINLIAYNIAAGGFAPSSPQRIMEFMSIILKAGVDVTRRQSLGGSIDAACGQLAAKNPT